MGSRRFTPNYHPHVRKVTHIVSLSPEALIAAPPVAGPSLTTAHPLFKEPALSGGDKVRPSGPVSSVVQPLLVGMFQLTFFQFLGHWTCSSGRLRRWQMTTPLPPQPPLPLRLHSPIMTASSSIRCINCSGWSIMHGHIAKGPRWQLRGVGSHGSGDALAAGSNEEVSAGSQKLRV